MAIELNALINAIQRNNIKKEDKGLVCLAVQEHFKKLQASGAIKRIVKLKK